MIRHTPFFVLSEHRIQDGQQLARTGNQCDFFGFSGRNQPHVKRFYHWIEAGCYECGHVQCGSYSFPTTKDGLSPSHRARIPVYWRNSHERAHFSSRKSAQFRNLTQQCGNAHGADAFNATQSIRELVEVVPDMVTHIFIDPRKLILQRFNGDINAFSALGMGWVQSIMFGIRQGTNKALPLRMEINNFRHLCRYSGVNTIGLRWVSYGTGEVTSLPPGMLKTFSLKRIGYGSFRPSYDFHQHKRNDVLSQLSHDGIKVVSVISSGKLGNRIAFETLMATQRGFGRLIITHPYKCVLWSTNNCSGFR